MKQQRRHYSAEEKAKSSLEAISCQQRATLEKRNAPEKRKSGDAVVRPSCRSSLLRDPGAKFLVETGHPNRTMKNSLNYVSTCLKVVDTRRFGYKQGKSITEHGCPYRKDGRSFQ